MRKLYIFLSCLLFSCASIQTLTGGEKDLAPPKIIKTSIDSGSTNIASNFFRFTFDENIGTSKVNELLLISPTQQKNPKLEIKGAQALLTLNDTLTPNTTYTVKFNGCIVDINENNPMLDYSYIFSTGGYLDSASISGYVKDVTTNLPCKNCNIQLYASKNDSIVIKIKPDYIAKTNEAGLYKLTNLPTQDFKLVAIQDANKNLLLDNGELVSLAQEINTHNTLSDTIYVFPFYHYIDYKPTLLTPKEPGVLKIAINKPLKHAVQLFIDDSIKAYQLSISKDTIYYYYQSTQDTLNILLNIDTNHYLFTYINPINLYIKPLKLTAGNYNGITTIKCNYLIKSIVKDKISLFIDSSLVSITDIYYKDYQVFIQHPLNLIPNKIEILEHGITDFIGNNNRDYSQALPLQKVTNSNLNLTINIDTNLYILHIYKGNSLYKTEYINSSKNLTLKNLPQGTYSCQLIKDLNQNQIWDTGDYFGHTKPEPILFTEVFEIRENWDKQLIINSF
jgi:hypothetical protein